MCWWELRLSLLVDRFSEKAVCGPCMLAGALIRVFMVARFGEKETFGSRVLVTAKSQ